MKYLILSILLTVSLVNVTLAQSPKQQIPQDKLDNMAILIYKSALMAQSTDVELFFKYIYFSHTYGTQTARINTAIKLAQCHIMWKKAIDLGISHDGLPARFFETSAWRSLIGTKVFVKKAGGDPEKVESKMIPALETDDVELTFNKVYLCTAIDLALYEQFKLLGMPYIPPDQAPKTKKKDNEIMS